jgi:uncharacterized cupin superfamily protein
MIKIGNLETVPQDYIDDPHFESPLQTKFIGAMAGCEQLYVNIDHVKPGAVSTKYHSHSLQEEFFLILRGCATLRIGDQSITVKAGDFFAKPAGKGIAHQFINDGDQELEILDCGVKHKNDLVEYPDEQVLLVKEKGWAFRLADRLTEWSSDPNQK